MPKNINLNQLKTVVVALFAFVILFAGNSFNPVLGDELILVRIACPIENGMSVLLEWAKWMDERWVSGLTKDGPPNKVSYAKVIPPPKSIFLMGQDVPMHLFLATR